MPDCGDALSRVGSGNVNDSHSFVMMQNGTTLRLAYDVVHAALTHDDRSPFSAPFPAVPPLQLQIICNERALTSLCARPLTTESCYNQYTAHTQPQRAELLTVSLSLESKPRAIARGLLVGPS